VRPIIRIERKIFDRLRHDSECRGDVRNVHAIRTRWLDVRNLFRYRSNVRNTKADRVFFSLYKTRSRPRKHEHRRCRRRVFTYVFTWPGVSFELSRSYATKWLRSSARRYIVPVTDPRSVFQQMLNRLIEKRPFR